MSSLFQEKIKEMFDAWFPGRSLFRYDVSDPPRNGGHAALHRPDDPSGLLGLCFTLDRLPQEPGLCMVPVLALEEGVRYVVTHVEAQGRLGAMNRKDAFVLSAAPLHDVHKALHAASQDTPEADVLLQVESAKTFKLMGRLYAQRNCAMSRALLADQYPVMLGASMTVLGYVCRQRARDSVPSEQAPAASASETSAKRARRVARRGPRERRAAGEPQRPRARVALEAIRARGRYESCAERFARLLPLDTFVRQIGGWAIALAHLSKYLVLFRQQATRSHSKLTAQVQALARLSACKDRVQRLLRDRSDTAVLPALDMRKLEQDWEEHLGGYNGAPQYSLGDYLKRLSRRPPQCKLMHCRWLEALLRCYVGRRTPNALLAEQHTEETLAQALCDVAGAQDPSSTHTGVVNWGSEVALGLAIRFFFLIDLGDQAPSAEHLRPALATYLRLCFDPRTHQYACAYLGVADLRGLVNSREDTAKALAKAFTQHSSRLVPCRVPHARASGEPPMLAVVFFVPPQ